MPGACTLATTGSYGPDRIVKTTYDAASQATKTTSALGVTGTEADDATMVYTSNGKLWKLTDANGNLTTNAHDGFDRLSEIHYPSPTTPGTSSSTDYDGYTFDATSNVTLTRLRDGTTNSATYDALNRLKSVTPAAAPAVTNTYDNLGRPLSTTDSAGVGVSFGYDALGRNVSETSYFGGTKTLQYDLAGRMTRLTWADGFYIGYDRYATGEVYWVRENGNAVIVSYYYDDLGRRTGIGRANGQATSYGYDGVSRLTAINHNFGYGVNDVSTSFTYNPANQIASTTRSNDNFAYAQANQDVTETPNGLNQLVTQASMSLSYDGRGNVTANGATTFGYNSYNQMTASSLIGSGGYNYYDPLGRMLFISPAGGPSHVFDRVGDVLISEWNVPGSDTSRRYVPGAGTDEYLLYYDQTGARRWLAQDERGSAIAIVNDSNTVTNINKYDDYGVPASGNTGTIGYTGQAWLPEFGMSYYKARMYAPGLGRFLQSDPIGIAGGINLYAYVGGDPVNLSDPSGLLAPDNRCAFATHCGSEYGYPLADPGPSPPWHLGNGGLGDKCALYTPARGVYDIHPCSSTFISGGQVGSSGSPDGAGGGGGMGGGARLTDPIKPILIPKWRTPNACQSRLYKFGAALNEGGKLGTRFGLGAAAVGAFGGGVGASPGLAAAGVGGAFSAGGQVLQDIALGRSFGSIALRGVASVFGGKLVGAVVPSGLRSELGDALAGEAFGDITDPVLGSGC